MTMNVRLLPTNQCLYDQINGQLSGKLSLYCHFDNRITRELMVKVSALNVAFRNVYLKP